jgi:HEAT repeat protein
MSRRNRDLAKTAGFILLLIGSVVSAPALAQVTGLAENGWNTWRAAGVASAPELCCYSWKGRSNGRQGCNLDGRNGGFGTSSDAPGSGDDVQIFVHLADGKVTAIRALSASCPVTVNAPVHDLGVIAADDSVAWLGDFVTPGNDLASAAILAVAVHQGDNAVALLLETAQRSTEHEQREDAIFWMSQVRVEETAGELRQFIFADADARIRKHAAFSYSQSAAGDVPEVLVRQGRDDPDPDVRSQAWFWLAQSGAVEAEPAIGQAMRDDVDEDVREDAVFALSQLPEERAIKVLGAILEDSGMAREVREQALFWLAQMESDAAFDYIDKILSSN